MKFVKIYINFIHYIVYIEYSDFILRTKNFLSENTIFILF